MYTFVDLKHYKAYAHLPLSKAANPFFHSSKKYLLKGSLITAISLSSFQILYVTLLVSMTYISLSLKRL